jgi:hypothetical protein
MKLIILGRNAVVVDPGAVVVLCRARTIRPDGRHLRDEKQVPSRSNVPYRTNRLT